jgi:hypothetical protein
MLSFAALVEIGMFGGGASIGHTLPERRRASVGSLALSTSRIAAEVRARAMSFGADRVSLWAAAGGGVILWHADARLRATGETKAETLVQPVGSLGIHLLVRTLSPVELLATAHIDSSYPLDLFIANTRLYRSSVVVARLEVGVRTVF